MEIEQLQKELEEIKQMAELGLTAYILLMIIIFITLMYCIVSLAIQTQKEKETNKNGK